MGDREELKKSLSPLEYDVLCNEATEPAFKNEYWDNKREGIYVDKISGLPLFSSLTKYDSGTGWPSFTDPIAASELETKKDLSAGRERIEVRSKSSDTHLGHVFDDGPGASGKRYCMNSASLRFIPKESMVEHGYAEYLNLFNGNLAKKTQEVVLGGGCFWGVEDLIRKLPGVLSTDVGYAGGHIDRPTYEQVKLGNTGHAEVVWIQFDSSIITYEEILDYFFRLHDPTTSNRQGHDVGTQYRSLIVVRNDEERARAKAAIERAQKSGRWNSPLTTEIVEKVRFWRAEDFHQDYLVRVPNGYTCHYLRD